MSPRPRHWGGGGTATDPDVLELWAKLTEVSDIVVSSKGINQDMRKQLLDAISETRELLTSAKSRSSENKRWAEMLAREIRGLRNSGLTVDSATRLSYSLSRIASEASR